eukprot:2528864-Pleurochrysis_carterae.AAC.3
MRMASYAVMNALDFSRPHVLILKKTGNQTQILANDKDLVRSLFVMFALRTVTGAREQLHCRQAIAPPLPVPRTRSTEKPTRIHET